MFKELNPSGFKQTQQICPLASYAIIAEYVLKQEQTISAFFAAIVGLAAAHSETPPPRGMPVEEGAYGSLYLKDAPWERLQAFKSLKWLHEISDQPAFADARRAFDLEWVRGPFDEQAKFERHTSQMPWLACVAHQDPPSHGVHCVCIGDDGGGMFRIETDFPDGAADYQANGAQRINGFADLGSKRLDALLIKPLTWPR